MGDIVPRDELVRRGGKGVAGVAGGIGIFLLRGIAAGGGFSIPGLIVGGIVTLIGLGMSSSQKDRPSGLITAAAGVLTAIASLPIVGGLASALMWIGGTGLLAGGIYSIYKFIKGIKSRS